MSVIQPSDRGFVRAVSQLNYTNPFLQQRLDLERAALGADFVPQHQPFWSFTLSEIDDRRSNLPLLTERARSVGQSIRSKLMGGAPADDGELEMYDDLTLYILFYELLDDWGRPTSGLKRPVSNDAETWNRYSAAFDYWLVLPSCSLPSSTQKLHLFSMFHQVYRAFFNIFDGVIGESLPAAKLRARIWQSIFTHDLRRYRRSLYRSMHTWTTLVTGPSGSGKELVARAIGMSRYVPFDPTAGSFVAKPDENYVAVNVSAFSSTLVESELFGHAKGAYTDAGAARVGWLESCGEYGAILLDEIGELEPSTQVKLLRVLQNRQYQRLGETKVREFQGKMLAATNRDLKLDIQSGRFRDDLYYRLCADVIETPSLADQIDDNPDVLSNLVSFITVRIAPEEHQQLTTEVVDWLINHLPSDYRWPGNIRELEQCVRNIMIHGQYHRPSNIAPSSSSHGGSEPSAAQSLVEEIEALGLTADELLCRYCQIAYAKTKSFEKAAKRLQLDRRTVRAKVT